MRGRTSAAGYRHSPQRGVWAKEKTGNLTTRKRGEKPSCGLVSNQSKLHNIQRVKLLSYLFQ